MTLTCGKKRGIPERTNKESKKKLRLHKVANVLIINLPCNLYIFIINVLLDGLSIVSFRQLNLVSVIRMYQWNHLKRSLSYLRKFQVYAPAAKRTDD